jgi:hypothetical protein
VYICTIGRLNELQIRKEVANIKLIGNNKTALTLSLVMAAVKGLNNMTANPGCHIQSAVLLTCLPTNFDNKELPPLILRSPQEILGTPSLTQAEQHIQVQPNLGLYSVVLGSEKYELFGPSRQESKKTELGDSNKCGDEQKADRVLTTVNMLSKQTGSTRPVTHIEIIRQKPNSVKVKHSASRRVAGANRVVPLITSMWQKQELKGIEPSLAAAYKTILDDPDNIDEHECEACHKQFLSATQVESHIKEMHPQQHVVLEQVCESLIVGQVAYFRTLLVKLHPV